MERANKVYINNIVETGLRHPQLFKKKAGLVNLIPKKGLGNVYQFSNLSFPESINNLLSLPGSLPDIGLEKNLQLAYILLYDVGNFRQMPTFFLPCLGITNKQGTDIKSYEKFLGDKLKLHEPYYTEEQKQLNHFGSEMWQHIENKQMQYWRKDQWELNTSISLFQLWQKVVPFLQNQKFVYKHRYPGKRFFKKMPFKKNLHRIFIKPDKPEISFRLIEKEAYYLLNIQLNLGGQRLRQFNTEIPFFIEVSGNLYLLSSLRDAGIVEWMGKIGNSLTVFKEQFDDFESRFLNPLKKYYSVQY